MAREAPPARLTGARAAHPFAWVAAVLVLGGCLGGDDDGPPDRARPNLAESGDYSWSSKAPEPTRDTDRSRDALEAGRRVCADGIAPEVTEEYVEIVERRERLKPRSPMARALRTLEKDPRASERRPALAVFAASVYAATVPPEARRDGLNGCLYSLRGQTLRSPGE